MVVLRRKWKFGQRLENLSIFIHKSALMLLHTLLFYFKFETLFFTRELSLVVILSERQSSIARTISTHNVINDEVKLKKNYNFGINSIQGITFFNTQSTAVS